jgi:hypothetical protein
MVLALGLWLVWMSGFPIGFWLHSVLVRRWMFTEQSAADSLLRSLRDE